MLGASKIAFLVTTHSKNSTVSNLIKEVKLLVKRSLTMRAYKVTYTAYEKGSCMVVSEGIMEINTQTSWQAEQTVKAMFSGLDVIIRYTNHL